MVQFLEQAKWIIIILLLLLKSWMATVVRQALTFLEQAGLRLRMFGGVEALDLFDVVAGEVSERRWRV